MSGRISICQCGDRYVLLDEERDRYFMLSSSAEDAYRAALAGQQLSTNALDALSRLDLILDAKTAIQPTACAAPKSSVFDQPPQQHNILKLPLAEVWASLIVSGWRLRHQTLAAQLNRLRARKSNLQKAGADPDSSHAIALFNRSRQIIPSRAVCLQNSLALLDWLHGRGYSADLVMGVRLSPFSAHCWVASNGILLNERVEMARTFVPIAVI